LTESVFLATLIPLLFLIGILKGEARTLILFFIWGLVAFLLSYYTNSWLCSALKLQREQMIYSVAPLVEEFFKFLPLLWFFFRKKPMNRHTIIFLGMAVGVGFSIQENNLYLSQLQTGELGGRLMMAMLRSVLTSLMHGLTTAMIGFGFSLIKDFRIFTFPLSFGLFAIAVTSHSLFNLYTNSQLRAVGILLPALIYLTGVFILYVLDTDKRIEVDGKT
jgi:RsiW-degrading membrane proteinase PrsW (M82 family)